MVDIQLQIDSVPQVESPGTIGLDSSAAATVSWTYFDFVEDERQDKMDPRLGMLVLAVAN